MTNRTVLQGFCAAVLLLLAPAGARCPAGEDEGSEAGVKRLYDFEIEEIKASFSKKDLEGYFVGKPYAGKIDAGWRTKDHVDELKLPDDHQGPVTVYRNNGSRDVPAINLYRKGATHGKYSKMYSPPTGGSEIKAWKYVVNYNKGNYTGLMAQPGRQGYHDIKDWFWQRYCCFFDDELNHRYDRRDWSAYSHLRVDVLSEGSPALVGMRAFDSSGPKIGAHYLGLRTALAVFTIPQDEQVTLDFPLAELAAAAEMNLSQMMGFVMRLNGYEGECKLYIDNIRLVSAAAAAGDARHKLVAMDGEPGPFARPVLDAHTARDAGALERRTGKIAATGPVTVFKGKGGYSSFGGHFGGSGVTYSQSLRRGCVAYDAERLCVIFGSGGLVASASFDGGKTWGGLVPGEKGPADLGWDGHYRATASSDAGGDLYMVGTENCCSYHEGYGVLFRRLALTGKGWESDRKSLVSQNLRKCPCDARALRLAGGRLWVTWTDGWKGQVAKHSDDDGLTWSPCKDASKPVPRPFYEPDLADLARPAAERPAPPKAILPWPGTPVVGSILVPFGDGVAALGREEWQVHDGKSWGKPQKSELGGCAAVLGADRIFRATGGSFQARAAFKPGPLVVAVFSGGAWKKETLEAGGIGDVILTSSGDAVFCFYVKLEEENRGNEVWYRRWKAGRWEEPRLVSREEVVISRLAAPMTCAPEYAAVWWDQRITGRDQETAVRFARVPNE